MGLDDWRSDPAVRTDEVLNLSVSERASGQVQTLAAKAAAVSALWELDVTLPQMPDGLIAAPLRTFNGAPFDEIDFEVVGRTGLQLTFWTAVGGRRTAVWSDKVIPGDLSGRRFRLGIAYEAGERIRLFVDGRVVADIPPENSPTGVPTMSQKPYFDLWAANGLNPDWRGPGAPYRPGND